MEARQGENISGGCDEVPGEVALYDEEAELNSQEALILSGDGGNWQAIFCA
jgi:hypothetical protein